LSGRWSGDRRRLIFLGWDASECRTYRAWGFCSWFSNPFGLG
jgi:hypothetical protein